MAGCLCASSSQPDTFTSAHQDALVLDRERFVDPAQVHLLVVPPVDTQQDILSQFWPRVTALVQQTARTAQPIELPTAERQVLAELEAHLLARGVVSEEYV